MKVYDRYSFNIADRVRFKDTKKYLDNMLASLGLHYNAVSFRFRGYITPLDKVTEAYPELNKYRHNDERNGYNKEVLSSEGYADPEDWDTIFTVASKIPRGFNIIPVLGLDNINWYGEETEESDYNSITMVREFDYGNKYNMIYVSVNATTENEPRNTTGIIDKLEPYLGKFEYKVRDCCFSREENELFKKRSFECEKHLRHMMEEFQQGRGKPDYKTDVPFIPNLADKKKIKEAFKNTDFVIGSRYGLLPGMNRVICIDEHNYEFEILIDRTQSSPNYFYFYIYVSGYNFHIEGNQNIMMASSEQEAEERLSEIASFSMKVKEEMGALLAESLGCTPAWYNI